MADVRIRWVLDVVGKDSGKQLLAQDRQIRQSLTQTDAQYRKVATTATSVSARQAAASRTSAEAIRGENSARTAATGDVARLAAAQREALSIGSRIITQSGQVERSYSRQGAASVKASTASENASRKAKTRAEEAVATNAILTGSLTRMARVAVTAGAGFTAAYIGIAKAKDAVSSTLELAHTTEILHRNLGLTVQSASAFAAVAKSRSIDVNSLGMGFQTLSKNAEAAVEGSAKQEKAFHSLGVTQSDLVKGTTDFAYLIGDVADKFQAMPGGVQRAAEANALLGRGYRSLLPLLNGGRKGLEDTLGTAQRYGATLDEHAIKQTLRLLDAQRKMSLASTGLKIAFTQVATPAMLSLSRVAETVSRDIQGPGSLDDKLGKVGTDVGPQLKKVEHLFEASIPVIADHVGHDAPKVAVAFVHGFFEADSFGKAVLAGYFLKKFGVLGAVFGGLGRANARLWALGFGEEAVKDSIPLIDARVAGAGAESGALGRMFSGLGMTLGRLTAVGIGLYLGSKLEPTFEHLLNKVGIHTSGSAGPVAPGYHLSQAQADALYGGKPARNAKRRGGTVNRFAEGGMVPALFSPGEMLSYGGGVSYVPGAPEPRDSVFGMVPAGTQVFTFDGQARLAAGMSPSAALQTQAPHFAAGGTVKPPALPKNVLKRLPPIYLNLNAKLDEIAALQWFDKPGHGGLPAWTTWETWRNAQLASKRLDKKFAKRDRAIAQGRSDSQILASDPPGFKSRMPGSWTATAYGPPWTGINGTGVTATGVDLRQAPHTPIVAVDPKVVPLHTKLHVWPNPFGQKDLTFLAEDTGSAIKGHHLDVYDWKGRGDQMRWGSRRVAVSLAGKGTAGSSPLVDMSYPLVPGPLRPQLRTLRGSQIDRKRLMSPVLADAYSQGYNIGLAGGRNVYDILPDVSSATGVQSVRTHHRVRQVSIFGGKAGSVKPGRRSLPSIRSAASSISSRRYNYEWGGGHNPSFAPTHGVGHGSGPGVGYDCSGAVSAVLHAGGMLDAPLSSGDFMNWGSKGPGKNMTIYAGPTHVFSKIGNRYFGTSGSQNPGGGAGWFSRWPGMPPGGVVRHPPGMRRGGIARFRNGGTVASQVFGKSGLTSLGALDDTGANRILKSLVAGLAGDTYDGVQAIITRIRKTIRGYLSDHVVTPQEQAKILRLRGALTLAQGEIGRKIGVQVSHAQTIYENAQQYGTFGAGAMAIQGIDPSSSKGLTLQREVLTTQRKGYQQSLTILKKQYAKAPPQLKSQIADVMKQIGADLFQTTVQLAENARAAVTQAAQDQADKAQFSTDYAQGALSGLDVSQRLAGTADTPTGMREKAAALQGQLLPALQEQQAAATTQYSAAVQTGDEPAQRQAILAIQQAGNDIASAMADAADLLKQAAEQAAQDMVDAAAHTTSMAQLGEAHLELQQRIAGTYDSGGQARADYITRTVEPAVQAEIAALQNQLTTAKAEGDQKLADQIAESIAGKQNELLQDQVDALDAIKSNTDPRKFGGTLGFTYGNEGLTDQLIAVGNGS